MAFLDNSGDILLDAVLTDEGRRRLAMGDGSFRITKFALGDDEIDYSSSDLPYLKPCSGKEYVEAYNPSKKALARKSYHGERALEKGEKEFDEFVKKTRKTA